MAELPDDIDAGVRPLVEKLIDAGFRPFCSCQGGEGHTFARPTVRLHGKGRGGIKRCRRKLTKFLLEHGVRGFTVSEHYQHQDGEHPWRCFAELELWSEEDLWQF